MKRVLRWLPLLLCLIPALVEAGPAVVVSAAPDKVGVTIYRNPDAGTGALDLEYLEGFALITETRTVDLPPGEATVRFEGVASGIVPQSAIIFGPRVREKNRDAALLSQRGLLDSFTGQRVTLRRTDRATGKATDEAAVIRSGSNGIVVETAHGFESVYCTGLNETLLFPGVPRTLSAKPVLSMTTRAQAGGRTTITLAYLAGRFDWQANYVGELSADATEINLLAWLTMASSDDTNFTDAEAAAVAGRVSRSENEEGLDADDATYLNRSYSCWPGAQPAPYPPPPVFAPMAMRFEGGAGCDGCEDIIVTGNKIARREDLGDLKLYRIPMRVTVAAHAQKQVAFLIKPHVKGAILYRVKSSSDLESPEMLFRFRNTKANGIGEPLPRGQVALFQQAAGRRTLVGEAHIDDKTIDEDIDLVIGEATNVTAEREDGEYGDNWDEYRLIVRNANPVPVAFEAEFATGGEDTRFERFSGAMVKRPGKTVWVTKVPANGTVTLRYREAAIE